MIRVTLLASDLGATAGASLAAAIAAHPRGRYAPTLVALQRSPSTASAYLDRLGVPVVVTPSRGPFDLAGLRALRRAVADSRPDVLHLIGGQATRLAPLLPMKPGVVSHAGSRRKPKRFDEFAVLPDDGAGADLAALGVPAGAKVILAAGDFGPDSGLREAVWAFDIFRYVHPGWHLLLVGDGPRRRGVLNFARALRPEGCQVHAPGARLDFPALCRAASAVWVVARRGSATAALEARSQGVPVLGFAGQAARLAGVDRSALAPAGDPVALASLTAEWAVGRLTLPTGHAPEAAAASAEAVAARAAGVYTH